MRYRVVVERNAFDRPGFFAVGGGVAARRRGGRVVPELPIRLIIVDRRIALVPLVSGGRVRAEIGALIVHESGMLDALLALFDRVWRDAAPLVLGATGVERPTSVRGQRRLVPRWTRG